MEIYTTIKPYELAENIADEEEAICVCVEILHQWNLTQKGYEAVLEKIPEFSIKQYLRKMRKMEKDHRERLSDLLKEHKANRQKL